MGFSKWIPRPKAEISEIVISFIDVTERKQIELLKSKEQSESASKAKTDFR
jgi:hypothetical protein